MNRKERLALAHWAVEHARKCGADEVSVDVTYTRDIEITYRDDMLEQLKESTTNGLQLSIYADHRFSGHSTNDVRKDTAATFIENAVAMTRHLSPDEHRRLPDPRYYEGRQQIDLQLVDPAYEKIDSAGRVELARAVEVAGRTHSDKVISCTGAYGDTYSESAKVHSNGFVGERQGNVYYAGAEVTIDDGTGGLPADWYYAVTRRQAELPSPEFLGREAAERALAKIGQKKVESGVYEMVIENRTAPRLIGALRSPMSARGLQQRSSFLEGKLDQKIGSPALTIIDDPFIPSGLGSCLYDDEGLATRRRVLIDKGVLKTFFVDNYYGRKLGWELTTAGPSNVVLEEGSRSLDELVQRMEKGILVTGFLGGNSNDTTGDFSYGIIGMLVENGEKVQAVNEMNISGNLLEFMAQLVEAGNDPYPYSSYRLPSLYFTDVQFSGV